MSVCISFDGKMMFCTDLWAVGVNFRKFDFLSLDFDFAVLSWIFVGGGLAAAAAAVAAAAAAAAAEVVVVLIVGRRFLINAGSRFSTFVILKTIARLRFVNTALLSSSLVLVKTYISLFWKDKEQKKKLYRLVVLRASSVQSELSLLKRESDVSVGGG